MKDNKKPIAIVIPWFGEKEKGGAELLAWELANRLSNYIPIEVLTTCSSEASKVYEWSVPKYKPGTEIVGKFKIKRFKTDIINYDIFNDVVFRGVLGFPEDKLFPGLSPLSIAEEKRYTKNNIDSISLKRYLRFFYWRYQGFLVLPYLYGLTINTVNLLKQLKSKIFLQPCLHDEQYAYMDVVRKIFFDSDFLLFNSEGEKELAFQFYGPSLLSKGILIGSGIEEYTAEIKERDQDNIKNIVNNSPFLLYLGRKSKYKNVDFLIQSFIEYKKNYPDSHLKLFLAGPGEIYNTHENYDIYDLGIISESEKEWLLANMKALVNASLNESFSRVMMEAWLHKKPVIMNGNCLATKIPTENSGAGWIASTESEWTNAFQNIETITNEVLLSLGEKGFEYAKANTNWSIIIQKYIELFYPSIAIKNKIKNKKFKKVFQLTHGFRSGDAISNHCLQIREFLEDNGFESPIRAVHLEQMNGVKKFNNSEISDKDAIIYHYSTGSILTKFAIKHKGSKLLIYHNITPASFYYEYDMEFSKNLERGREELKLLKDHFSYSLNDSQFNSNELVNLGFENVGVLPILFQEKLWKLTPDAELCKKFNDGKKNIVFIGRIAPNKKQDDLLNLIYELKQIYTNFRLVLCGIADDKKYLEKLGSIVRKLDLSSFVFNAGVASQSQLLSIYQTADLFCSMSEHEGFCVPIVESMFFNVPVLAYNTSAVPETMEKSGILFNSKGDKKGLAALTFLLLTDEELRSKVIQSQKIRRDFFTMTKQKDTYAKIIHLLQKQS